MALADNHEQVCPKLCGQCVYDNNDPWAQDIDQDKGAQPAAARTEGAIHDSGSEQNDGVGDDHDTIENKIEIKLQGTGATSQSLPSRSLTDRVITNSRV